MNPEDKKYSVDSTHSTDPMNSSNSALNTLSSAIFYLAILFFIIGFNFSDVMVGNWYQQFLPDLNGRTISDVTFLDSLTGFAVTPYRFQNDTSYVLKTTNSGDNWFIQHSRIGQFVGSNRIIFLDQNTGYTAGGSNLPLYSSILKTTNGGNNWNNVNAPANPFDADDASILNEDTLWVVSTEGLTGGVFRTTNGGGNWDRQLNLGSNNPDKIYFYNRNLGFCGRGIVLYRTTNSGVNWNIVPGEHSFTDMSFVDSLTGWKVRGNDPDTIKKTTNGGVNWFKQYLPIGNWINTMFKIAVLNKDTIWGVGGVIQWIPSTSNFRGLIYKTTNGGLNWGYQIPDTGANYYQFTHIQFVNKLNGWAYLPSRNIYSGFHGFHTNTGGDTTILKVQQTSSNIPVKYLLFQNYPNPFNPVTNIKFHVTKPGFVRIILHDITGKEIETLINKELNAGEYKVDWNASAYSSGIYFYSYYADGKFIDSKKMLLIK